MNIRTKTGLQVLQFAIVIGILGDVLLRVMPWGLNVLLFNAAFAAAMIVLLKRFKPEYLTRQTWGLFGALIFFASMFVWRDSLELRLADTVAILAILSVLLVPKMKIPAQAAGVFQYGFAFLYSSFNAAFAPFALVFSDVEWGSIERSGWTKHLFSVLRGVAIAAPILLIFGALFVAADAAYEGLVQRVFNIDPAIVFTHVLLTSIFAWFSAGYLRGVMIDYVAAAPIRVTPTEAEMRTAGNVTVTNPNQSKVENLRTDQSESSPVLPNNLSVLEHINLSDPPNIKAESRPAESVPSPDAKARTSVRADNEEPMKEPVAEAWDWNKFDNTIIPPVFTLGPVEIGLILGLTNLLFLSFVIVQVPYLFGGMDLVQSTPDFKLAEYARRGFGELVTVSALVLPILLASHWLIKKDSPVASNLFRVFAGIQIVLLFVIMASAVQRLVLLTGNLGYGLTTIRLYPMIFMAWLAVVFIWFSVTVLRNARQHFAWGALWGAFLILGAMHVLNPDAFIVKTNIALMHQGRDFDAAYNSRLSDDALPELLDSYDELNSEGKKYVLMNIGQRYCDLNEETDLRSWNYAHWQASKALMLNEDEIMRFGKCSGSRYGYPR